MMGGGMRSGWRNRIIKTPSWEVEEGGRRVEQREGDHRPFPLCDI